MTTRPHFTKKQREGLWEPQVTWPWAPAGPSRAALKGASGPPLDSERSGGSLGLLPGFVPLFKLFSLLHLPNLSL